MRRVSLLPGARLRKRSDIGGASVVFEAGEAVPECFKVFLVSTDQWLVVKHEEIFFVVFSGSACPVVAAIQQDFLIEDGVFVVHVPLGLIDPQLDSGLPESICI